MVLKSMKWNAQLILKQNNKIFLTKKKKFRDTSTACRHYMLVFDIGQYYRFFNVMLLVDIHFMS